MLFNAALLYILPVVLDIFNFSLMQDVFPTLWKSALVMPLPKVSSPSTVQYYRPISILCYLSKVLERLVVKQLIIFLEQ